MKHESLAKAEVKGAMRRASTRWEALEHSVRRRLWKMGSRKQVLRFMDAIIECRGDFLIDHHTHTRAHSWHFVADVVSIQDEYRFIEGVGNVTGISMNLYDSRQILKGTLRGLRSYQSKVLLGEHFLIRVVQRLGLSGIGQVGSQVFPLLEHLVHNYPSARNLENKIHFVSREHVLIAEKLPTNKGIVLKTILLCDLFEPSQDLFYAKAIKMLKETGVRSVMFLPESGKCDPIAEKAPPSIQNLLASGNKFWIHDIMNEITESA